MVIKVNDNNRIDVVSSVKGLHIAPMLYSDKERSTTGAIWFEVVHNLCGLRELDHLNPENVENMKISIGGALASVLMVMAKCDLDCTDVLNQERWNHRGPDAKLSDLNMSFQRLADNSGRIAGCCRAVLLAEQRMPVVAASTMAVNLCREAIFNGDERSDLYTVAAFHKLSLRECYEAFVATRISKILKNAKRYGK